MRRGRRLPILGRLVLRVSIAGVLAAGLGPSFSGVAGQEARARVAVDTTLVTVGDQIRMSVTVEHATGAEVVWPDSLDLAPFEVLAAEASPPESDGDRMKSGAVLTLTAFELGELEIPSFDIEVVGPDGGTQTLATDRFGVEVVTVGTDENGDIRDIRGPLGIPVGVVRVSLWMLLAILAGALGVWLLRRRGNAAEAPIAPAPRARPAYEVALEALDRIEASPMLQRGHVKAYHIQASQVLRTYVEAEFNVPSLEMTTREVIDGLRAADADAEFTAGLRRFLDQCDLVKFAKVRPTNEASVALLTLGRELVEMSRPVAAPSTADVTPSTVAEAMS